MIARPIKACTTPVMTRIAYPNSASIQRPGASKMAALIAIGTTYHVKLRPKSCSLLQVRLNPAIKNQKNNAWGIKYNDGGVCSLRMAVHKIAVPMHNPQNNVNSTKDFQSSSRVVLPPKLKIWMKKTWQNACQKEIFLVSVAPNNVFVLQKRFSSGNKIGDAP